MSESATRELEHAPTVLPGYARAARQLLAARLPGVPGSGSAAQAALPATTLTCGGLTVDRDHVAAYSRLCGFPLRDTLPATYPHVLVFGMHMELMTAKAFPFPVVGMVHIANTITQHRAIGADETLHATVHAENLRGHAKGRQFDLVSQVHSDGEPVWRETSTMLHRGPAGPDPDPGPQLEVVPGSGARFRLPGDLGRRYAGVSGDVNPIHLSLPTAKVFGFPRQIAHGMWSAARCLAALDDRLSSAVSVEVAFKKPVLLPGTVAFAARHGERGWEFSLTSPRSGAPHVLGRAAPLG